MATPSGPPPPNVDGRTRLLGIVGDPLAHSLSPALHSEVLRRLGRNLLYVPLPVSADRLPALFALAPSMGLVGVNVTTPYKELVATLVRPLDRETARVGMVNTVAFALGAEHAHLPAHLPARSPMHGRARARAYARAHRRVRASGAAPVGCGTDGAGILDALERWGLEDAPLAVLGFGATARSLVHRAWRAGRGPLAVVTRRTDDVETALAGWRRSALRDRRERLPGSCPRVVSWEEGSDVDAAVWISTLPPNALDAVPRRWLRGVRRDAVVVDLNYGEGRDGLAQRARARGLRAADGRGPLLAQAARSLGFWLGQPVDVALFERALGVSRRSLAPARS